jgi:hypothetical protein
MFLEGSSNADFTCFQSQTCHSKAHFTPRTPSKPSRPWIFRVQTLDPSDQPQLKITENLEVTVYTSMSSGLYWASAVLAVVIGIFALDIMGLFSWKNHLDVDGKVWHHIVDGTR